MPTPLPVVVTAGSSSRFGFPLSAGSPSSHVRADLGGFLGISGSSDGLEAYAADSAAPAAASREMLDRGPSS